jgi:glycerol-3-phosphate dehydrogenase (NAD(P)+)
MRVKATVLGAGSWGTALAFQLARRDHDVVLWDRNASRCAHINTHHVNPRYLRSVELPPSLYAEPDLPTAVAHAELLVVVVPSHALREVMLAALPHIRPGTAICCATKGIEEHTLLTMDGVLEDILSEEQYGHVSVLSGPSFALELAKGLPTAVAIAGPDPSCLLACDAFHGNSLRTYHTDDKVGLCIGGSFKNIMAIACGVADGVGLGVNARAALITRGLAEMTRVAVAAGANPLTMMGLGGVGDLVLTCTGNLSRNRRVGLALGAGKTLDVILEELGEVAEGVTTARSAVGLGKQLGIELPITEQVHALLYEGKPALQGMVELLGRERRAERDDSKTP